MTHGIYCSVIIVPSFSIFYFVNDRALNLICSIRIPDLGHSCLPVVKRGLCDISVESYAAFCGRHQKSNFQRYRVLFRPQVFDAFNFRFFYALKLRPCWFPVASLKVWYIASLSRSVLVFSDVLRYIGDAGLDWNYQLCSGANQLWTRSPRFGAEWSPFDLHERHLVAVRIVRISQLAWILMNYLASDPWNALSSLSRN